jgi:hypothetical protein
VLGSFFLSSILNNYSRLAWVLPEFKVPQSLVRLDLLMAPQESLEMFAWLLVFRAKLELISNLNAV